MHQHRHRRLFLNFASQWIKNKKLEFKAQRLDEKTGQRLFERMLNKNIKEDSDAGEMNPLRINDNQKKK